MKGLEIKFLIQMCLHVSWTCIFFPAGMDSAEQYFVYCAARQPSSTTVCGETGEDPAIRHQRKGPNASGPRQHLGRSGEAHSQVSV